VTTFDVDIVPARDEVNVEKPWKKVIHLKEELAGEKDRAVLPVLRHTLEQKRQS
jgi:hypothetical protein